LATVYLRLGQPSEARAWAQAAWEDAKTQNDDLVCAQAWARLGLVAQSEGDIDLARQHFLESLQQVQRLGERLLAVDCVMDLALLDLNFSSEWQDWAQQALRVVEAHPASTAWHRREAGRKINQRKSKLILLNAEQELQVVIQSILGLVS
jgi:tetratricopeptide (TPR) repeat protein